jgi:hypothetical protein
MADTATVVNALVENGQPTSRPAAAQGDDLDPAPMR